MAFLFDFYHSLISIDSMNLLQKFISVFLIQLLGFFILNPLFANAESDFIITTSNNISDNCSKNIQCYQVSDNQYSCTETESAIVWVQSHISSIQIGKTDTVISKYSDNQSVVSPNYAILNSLLYQDPELKIYPFVGIIKIQV